MAVWNWRTVFDARHAQIALIAHALLAEAKNPNASQRLTVDCLTDALVAQILRDHSVRRPKTSPERGKLPNATLLKINDYIQERLDADLSLEELAAICRDRNRAFPLAVQADNRSGPASIRHSMPGRKGQRTAAARQTLYCRGRGGSWLFRPEPSFAPCAPPVGRHAQSPAKFLCIRKTSRIHPVISSKCARLLCAFRVIIHLKFSGFLPVANAPPRPGIASGSAASAGRMTCFEVLYEICIAKKGTDAPDNAAYSSGGRSYQPRFPLRRAVWRSGRRAAKQAHPQKESKRKNLEKEKGEHDG